MSNKKSFSVVSEILSTSANDKSNTDNTTIKEKQSSGTSSYRLVLDPDKMELLKVMAMLSNQTIKDIMVKAIDLYIDSEEIEEIKKSAIKFKKKMKG